jgi:hypothetical protein
MKKLQSAKIMKKIYVEEKMTASYASMKMKEMSMSAENSVINLKDNPYHRKY